ncbi:MAG TPA: FG-GAP-like repeat-containing protein [Archangium sp.]|uniref:FG-GAP-like repeat-containing protein n=1 Tax=Archangium sp. TaxID=1872627 RepID=UPI002E2EB757|nr:FG-GAP-like repeat-containing protein [Archangium sp.]HEX5754589.1 FG-GAP-like repeat-containing protein [Archangium sp.]
MSRRLIPLFLALLVGAGGCDDLKPITTEPPTPPPTAPSAPGPVQAHAEPGTVTLSWSPPENDGGTALTGYRVHGEPQEASLAVSVTGATARVTGLRAGATYRFSVAAVNKAGEGPATLSESVTLPDIPGAPPQPSVVRGDGQVRVSWTEPDSDGRSPLTGYLVTAQPQGLRVTADASARSVVVEGLHNGEPSTFTVRALNAVGEGPDSPASPAVVPATVPSAPTRVEATADIRQATITWSAPASTGGLSVQSYVVTASPGGASREVDADAHGVTFSGLENGTAYTFTVVARNEVGEGPGLPSASVHTPGVPSQPGAVSVTTGARSATVTWEAPAEDGGRPLTGYVVESSPSGARITVDASTRSATFTGLTSTRVHSFSVSATNAVGPGATASPPAAVRPLPAPVEVTDLQLDTSDAGCLTVSYSLRQPDGVRADVSVEVESSGSGSFATATQASALAEDGSFTHEGTHARSSSPEGLPHRFRWNRSLDVPGAATVRVRLSARVPGTPPGSATLERTLPAPASRCELRLPTSSVQLLTATPSTSVSGDFNGDGRLDLVVVPDSGDTLSLLEGLGNGSFFRSPFARKFRGSLKRLSAGDLDGDGLDELLWMDTSSGSLWVMRRFGEPVSYPLGSSSLSDTSTRPIAIADFDGNGSPDVATLGGSGSPFPFLGILANAGDGTLRGFTPKAYVPRDALLEVADLDEDGRMDLLAIGRNWFGSSALLSNGDGTFRQRSLSPALPSIPTTAGSHALTVGDVDGDGHTDLVLAWKDGSASRVQVHLLRGDGQGGFSAAVLVDSLPDISLGTWPLALTAVDMDHDGLKDLAVGLYDMEYNYTVAVLRSRGADGFAPARMLPSGRVSISATAGDFDGDGRDDLATVQSFSWDVRVWRSGPEALSLPEGPTGPLAQGDFNGDGKMDLLSGPAAKTVQVHLAGGPEGLRDLPPMPVGSGVYRMVVGHVDEDSALDVVVLSGESAIKTVELLLGNGDGTFRTGTPISVGAQALHAALGDVNGDGRMDLAFQVRRFIEPGFSTDEVRVLLGQGAGTFGPAALVTTSPSPGALALGDLNRDGVLDLAVAQTSSGGGVLTLKGQGDGTFLPPVLTTDKAGQLGGHLVLTDMSGDGVPDLVRSGDGNVYVLTTYTATTWGSWSGWSYPAGGNCSSFSVLDFDGDGRKDVLCSNPGSDSVSLLRGKPYGQLAEPQIFAVRFGAVGLGVLDVNADGRPDIVLGTSGEARSTLLLQR